MKTKKNSKTDSKKISKSNKSIIKLEKKNKINNKELPKKKKKLNSLVYLFLYSLIIIGIIGICLTIAFATYIVIQAPKFDTKLLYNKEATVFYDRNGNEFARIGAEQREKVTYDQLPEVLIDAIIATEDARFFQHNGFDIVRFTKASLGQAMGKKGSGGASTLTMQVVKNTFTSTTASGIKGIIRKFTDIYMSIFMVERNYTKEEIIEFYVNKPFLGNNTYGIEQASKTYFGKSVSDLTLAEASLLAGIFNAPSVYNPFYSTELASQRRNIVLDLMVRHGYITKEQADDAKAISVESLIVDQSSHALNKYQTFIDAVVIDVEKKTKLNPYDVSMEIYTTMDPNIQDVMTALNDGSLGYKWKKDWIQFGAAITDVKDGSIIAVNGGRNQNGERLYNRAITMKTQPGSTAKPIFAYGPYLEYNKGNTGTLFFDNKMTYSNGQSVKNSDGSYQGALTMRQALARSRNIPAIQAFQAVDKAKIAEFVHNCGIDYGDTLYEAHSIGGGLQVSPLDMAAAYGTFARGGYYIEPYSFTKIIFTEDNSVYEHKYKKQQAMSEETAYMITDILLTATKQGVGGNIRVSNTDIASKTGTSTYDSSALKQHGVPSSASADNWVITYSPDYVISFWYGVDKLEKGKYTDSIDAAIERKKISALISNKIYKTNSHFTKPSGVIAAKYELETNPAALPSDYTPASLISTELFRKGTEPSEVSNRFSQLENPRTGSGTESNGVITLKWDQVETPKAISTTYLEKYFNENYGQFAQIYLEKRYEYNNNNIGTLGYQVYLQNDNGLTFLGYTNNSSYTYSTIVPGTYNFVIKTAYSIFNYNASSGLTISVTINGSSSSDEEESENQDNNNTENQNANPINTNIPISKPKIPINNLIIHNKKELSF